VVSSAPRGQSAATSSADKYPRPSAWVGWIAFAAVSMVVMGSFHAMQGLLALIDADSFPVETAGSLIELDSNQWGWVHLIGGTLLMVAGLCVFAGQTWARAVGVLVVISSAVVNFGFLDAYPIWSLMMLMLDVVVIFALTVHGSEIKP
jgi:hypothetical protein